jgi:hypothetical protein
MLDNSFELESKNSIISFNNTRTENESFESQIENISLHEMLDISQYNIPRQEEQKKNSNIFITNVVTNDTSLLGNKKRGRHSISENEDKKNHDRFSDDNILRKIQVHYLSFIISFINDILKSLGFKEKFLNLNYKFKQVVNKRQFNKLKRSNIGEIISNKISTKYKRTEENKNFYLYKQFETNKVLGKIFGMNYLTFLKMFYLKNEKNVDLRILGIDKEITLSKNTKTYYELLGKLKKEEDENYINQIKECLNKNYLMRKIFALC